MVFHKDFLSVLSISNFAYSHERKLVILSDVKAQGGRLSDCKIKGKKKHMILLWRSYVLVMNEAGL